MLEILSERSTPSQFFSQTIHHCFISSSWAMHNVQLWISQLVFMSARGLSVLLELKCNFKRCKY